MADEMKPILFSCINQNAVDQALVWLQSYKMSLDKFPQNSVYQLELWCTPDVETDVFKHFPEVKLRYLTGIPVHSNGMTATVHMEGMVLRLQALDIYHQLFPEGIQLVYMDTDLVVNGDISGLSKPPMGPDQWLAACSDFSHLGENPFDSAYAELIGDWDRRMSINKRYFNSGVMVIRTAGLYKELSRYRHDSLCSFYDTYKEMCYFPDQDALNKLAQNYLEMPRIYNAFPEYHIHSVLPIDLLIQHRKRLADASVIHFLGMAKPWRKARMVNRISIQLPYEVYWKYVSPIASHLSPELVEGVRHNIAVNRIIIEQVYQKHLTEIV